MLRIVFREKLPSAAEWLIHPWCRQGPGSIRRRIVVNTLDDSESGLASVPNKGLDGVMACPVAFDFTGGHI